MSVTYIIYKRTTPDGKVYIGCTSESLSKRSGSNGIRYNNQPTFYNAILKFDWSAVKSEVLKTTTDYYIAKAPKSKYIAEYKSTDPNSGYNVNAKSGYSMTEERKEQLRESVITAERYGAAVHSEEFRAKQRESQSRPQVKQLKSAAIRGRIHITDGRCSKMIKPQDFKEYERRGWYRGRAPFRHKEEE